VSARRRNLLAGLVAVVALGAGCRQDMHDQPRLKAQARSEFWRDDRAGRPLVEGTIPRGHLREDEFLYTGRQYGQFVNAFPFVIDQKRMERGRDRYNIYCAPCHGATGAGNGMVVQRGYRAAGNFHQDRLRNERLGYFYDVIANGFGAMPDYAAQIGVEDRWAIVAYIRALQLSQHARLEDVPAARRAEAEKALSGAAPAAAGAAH
jgi:mono/diheme cytochrome c family protein